MTVSRDGACARCGGAEAVQVVGLPGEGDAALAPLCRRCRSTARGSGGAPRCGMDICQRTAEYILEHDAQGVMRVCGEHAANMVEAGVATGVKKLV